MKKWFDNKEEKYRDRVRKLPKESIERVEKFETKTENFLKKNIKKFIYWLNWRNYHEYDYKGRLNYLINIILGFAISLVAFIIFYSNTEKLNEIKIWIIKLEGILLLVSLFFIIKYGWKILKEISNWFKRERNWVRYIIIIGIVILLWYSYANRDTILNPVFDYYNQTNFSVFSPLDIKNFTWKDEASFNYGEDKKITIPTSIKATMDVSKIESKILELVNNERLNNGARALTSTSYLSDLARKHSQRMINEDFFEHSNYNLGENIGEVPIWADVIGCGSTYSDDNVAECFVSGWISSPGHHANMIDRSYFSTGIGVACDNSKCRATEVFS